MHLRHAYALADLCLSEVLLEAQSQDLAFTWSEGTQQLAERRPIFGRREATVVISQPISDRAFVLFSAAARSVE